MWESNKQLICGRENVNTYSKCMIGKCSLLLESVMMEKNTGDEWDYKSINKHSFRQHKRCVNKG